MKKEKTLKETIYNAILEDIFSLEYRPGDILNERNLVEKYKCSKSPIREALLELCKDHVLRNIPRYGYEVLKLTIADVAEIMQFRYVLETGMLRWQFEKITQVQLEALERIDQKCREEDNVWKHWEYNAEFHLKLIGFSRNYFVLEELKRSMDRLKRAHAQFYWDKQVQTSVHLDTMNHTKILEAIKEKNLQKALHYLAEDMNNFGGLNYQFITEDLF